MSVTIEQARAMLDIVDVAYEQAIQAERARVVKRAEMRTAINASQWFTRAAPPPQHRLTSEDVARIGALVESGLSFSQIAHRCGCSSVSVRRVAYGEHPLQTKRLRKESAHKGMPNTPIEKIINAVRLVRSGKSVTGAADQARIARSVLVRVMAGQHAHSAEVMRRVESQAA